MNKSKILPIPNFLIIGAMKCGTTSLHDYLGLHPNIYTSTPKEVHYFSDPQFQTQTWEWYLDHFKTDKAIAGTAPQNYTKRHRKDFGDIPPRIKEHLPGIKLIYIVRNPLERIYSHYYEAQEGGYAPREGLNAYLKNYRENHYVLTSCYYYQISRYLQYFPKEQIHLLSLEQLRDDRLNTLNRVFRFLEVQELENEALFDFQSNAQADKTRPNWVWEFFQSKNADLIKSVAPKALKEHIRQSSLFRSISRTSELRKETIVPELESKIRSFLKKDIDQLRIYWYDNFPDWSV